MRKPHDPSAALAHSLVNASVRLVRWLRAADPAPQLTAAQASALAVIVWSGGLRPSDLARIEEIKRPTAARVIGELVSRGLVVRDAAVDDGRSAMLRATAAGREVLAEGQARRCQPLALALARLSPSERERVAEAVETLNAILQRELGTGPVPPFDHPAE